MSAIGRFGQLVALGAALLGLAACADSSESSPNPGGGAGATIGGPGSTTQTQSGSGVDACGLLTTEELTAALGKPPGSSKLEKLGDAISTCRWEPSGVTETLHRDHGKDQFASLNGNGTPVLGIGDQAATLTGTLYILKGTSEAELDLTTESPAVMTRLGRTAADRM